MPGVRLEAVSKHFGGVGAVDAVSLDVADGEFVTLLGRSGCGKTTTLRMIAGLERNDAGRIYIGERMVSSPGDWRLPAARAPQHRHGVSILRDLAAHDGV